MNAARRLVTALLWVGLALLAVSVLALGRAIISARSELNAARTQETQGEVDASIVHYRRAASWHAPLNPYSSDALAALRRLGLSAERDVRLERALNAWRAIRGSLMGTRSLYTPRAQLLGEANAHIAQLMAEQEPASIDAGMSRSDREAAHLNELNESRDPRRAGVTLSALGLLLFVLGVGFTTFVGLDTEGRFTKAGRALATSGVIGFGMMVVGLLIA